MSSLPKRYIQAQSNLAPNPNTIVSPADKSGGFVMMLKQRYVDKINSLLEDTNTYEISNQTTIKKDIISFKNLVKNKKPDIPHRIPPYNLNIMWPTQNPQTKHPPNDPLSLASVEPPTK